MSFNKLMYDKCATKEFVKESTAPGHYMLNTPKMCNECYQDNPEIRLQKSGDSIKNDVARRYYAGPIDTESDLMNIDHPTTKCSARKFNPTVSNCGCENQGEPGGAGVIVGCKSTKKKLPHAYDSCRDGNNLDFPTCYLPVENTRLSNPSMNLRGIGINRFDPLCLDPQAQILFPGDYAIPSRLVSKDNHRPCVPVPAVNNMLPPQKDLPCIKTNGVCGAYTAPLYQYDKCG